MNNTDQLLIRACKRRDDDIKHLRRVYKRCFLGRGVSDSEVKQAMIVILPRVLRGAYLSDFLRVSGDVQRYEPELTVEDNHFKTLTRLVRYANFRDMKKPARIRNM